MWNKEDENKKQIKKTTTKIICGLLLGLLCFVSGCGQKEQENEAAVSDIETAVSTGTDVATAMDVGTGKDEVLSDAEIPLLYNVEDYLDEDWKRAYYEKLKEIRANNARVAGEEIVYKYYLYDIDKDEVPELIAHKGSSAAVENIDVYTYRDGEVQFVDNMYVSHESFFTYPEGNGMLARNTHMNGFLLTKYILEDGTLKWENLADEQILQGECIPPLENYVQGAEYLDAYLLEMDLPLVEYGWSQEQHLSRTEEMKFATGERLVVEKEDLINVFENNGMVYGVSGDGFGGDTGYVSFEEYCAPGTHQNELPMEVKDYLMLNLDDSVVSWQAALWLEEQPGGRDKKVFVILCIQEGVAYAYCFSEDYDYNILAMKDFLSDGRSAYRFSFYKDQCYLSYAQAYTKYLESIREAIVVIEDTLPDWDNADIDKLSENLPERVHLLDCCVGDIGNDGKMDFVMVLKYDVQSDSDEIHNGLYATGPTVVCVFQYAYQTGTGEDVYRCNYINNTLVLDAEAGGTSGAPYNGIIIENGVLRMFEQRGEGRDISYEFGMREDKFLLEAVVSQEFDEDAGNLIYTIWNYETHTVETYETQKNHSHVYNLLYSDSFDKEDVLFEDAGRSYINTGIALPDMEYIY